MSNQPTAPPRIKSSGEELDIYDIMQRFRNDGSCDYIIEDALTRLATPAPTAEATSARAAAEEIVNRVNLILTPEIRAPYDEVSEIAAIIARHCSVDTAEATCEWKETVSRNYWLSGCGHHWGLGQSAPKNQGWKHCPFCGRKIK